MPVSFHAANTQALGLLVRAFALQQKTYMYLPFKDPGIKLFRIKGTYILKMQNYVHGFHINMVTIFLIYIEILVLG